MVVRVPTPHFGREDSYEKQKEAYGGKETSPSVKGKFAELLESEV
jgi:hypothetical protein